MSRLHVVAVYAGAYLFVGSYLACGDSGSDGAAPDGGASSSGASSGASSGSTSSGAGSSGTSGSSGDPNDSGADGGRVVYPPGAGSVTVTGGALTCTQGNWTRQAFTGSPIASNALPLAAVGRGDEVYALFQTGGSTVVYAKRDGAGTWSSEAGPTISGSGYINASLTFDDVNAAHATFAGSSFGSVTYATRTGPNAWSTSTVVAREAYVTSVAVESDGTPYVAVDGLGTGANGDLEAFHAFDGGWVKETAATSYLSMKNVGPQIAIGPAGAIVICYDGTTNFQSGIGCVQRAALGDGGGAWSPIVSLASFGEGLGFPSFARATDGATSIAFRSVQFVMSAAHYEMRVVPFAPVDGGLQQGFTDVLDTSIGAEFDMPQIFREASGDIHVGYHHSDGSAQSALKYVHIRPDGSATGAVVACNVAGWKMAMRDSGPLFIYSTAVLPTQTSVAFP